MGHILRSVTIPERSETMLFSSPGVQAVSKNKTEHQIAEASKRLSEVNEKLSKASVQRSAVAGGALKDRKNRDWTKNYAGWNNWEDVDELEGAKKREEATLESVMSRQENLGHYHDHSSERSFFEKPEEEKFQSCEDNRMLGNFLFREGMFPKAAEHYQIALAYYEYCFLEEEQQCELDELRRACLCNTSLCYQKMGSLRLAVEAATTVLKETEGRHGKALFRRAVAYRCLDEYK
jgi:tetratricopeptide (TPR) repeat protein